MIRVLSLPGRNHKNRYFRLLCDSLETEGLEVLNIRDRKAWAFQFDVFHIHFPTHFVTQSNSIGCIFWAFLFAAVFLTAKLLSKRIVYTIHDVIPINVNRGWLLWPFLKLVHALCDGYVFLNQSSQNDFYVRFFQERGKPSIIVRHGPYPVQVLTSQQQLQSRLDLVGQSEDLLVGFFGNIKPYKNLAAIASLPAQLSGGRPVRSIVVGRVEPGYEQQAEEILRHIPPANLLRIDSSPSDQELDKLIQAVDVVMLPYTVGWNSGAAILALSNKARVLGSDLPVFAELEASVGPPWVYIFRRNREATSASLEAVMETIALDKATPADENRLAQFLSDCSWVRGARDLHHFYENLVCRRERAASTANAE